MGVLSLVVYYIRLHPWGDFWKRILKPVIHELGIVAYFNGKTAANISNKYTVNMVISAIPRALNDLQNKRLHSMLHAWHSPY